MSDAHTMVSGMRGVLMIAILGAFLPMAVPGQTSAPKSTSPKSSSPASAAPASAAPTSMTRDAIPPTSLPAMIFAPTSFWYTPIPKDAPLHPNSENFVKEFLRQKKAYYGTVSINLTAYASPIYIAGPNVTAVKVTEWDGQKKDSRTKTSPSNGRQCRSPNTPNRPTERTWR